METISFSDRLVHYKVKLKETMDYLDTVSSQLNTALGCAESSWQGQSAQACADKLEELKPELMKARYAVAAVNETVRAIERLTLGQII